MAAGSKPRSAPAGGTWPDAADGTPPGAPGGTRPGPLAEEPSRPAAGARSGAAGETGAAGEPVGRPGLAAICGMNAVGESATDGAGGAVRLGVPEGGFAGVPPGAAEPVEVGPGIPLVAAGRAVAAPGDAGRVEGGVGPLTAAPGDAGRAGPTPGDAGRAGAAPGDAGPLAAGDTGGLAAGDVARLAVEGRPDPGCGLDPCEVLPGQGGGASAPGRPEARGGSKARDGSEAREGSEARGGSDARGGSGVTGGRDAAGRAGSTGSGQLPAGVARPGVGSGRSTFGRMSVGSSVWLRCRPSRRSSGPLTWAPSPSAGRSSPRMPALAPWKPSPCNRVGSRRPRP